jgi:serine protease
MAERALRTKVSGAILSVSALAAAAAGCAGPPNGEEELAAARLLLEPGEALFLDGQRPVRAVRTGPRSSDTGTDAAALTPLTLRYGGGRPEVPALVGERAIIEVASQGSDQDIEPLFAELGVRAVRPLMRSAGLWLVEDEGSGDGLDVAARVSAQLQSNTSSLRARGLRSAVPDLYLRHRPLGEPFAPNDPRFPGQWYFEDLNMSEAWSYTKGDPSVTVVVIDSGCDMAHPDLAAKMDPGRDVIDGDDDASFAPNTQDNAHGTACAGLVAAVTDNNEGVAGGCPECRLRCVRLLGDEATPISADVEAFTFALDSGAAVVSNSWGFSDPIPVPKAIETAINQVFDTGRGGLGALVLFAAGNDAQEVKTEELLGVRGVLGIGAVNHLKEETSFTNYGDPVDLVAFTGQISADISGSDGYDSSDYTDSFGGTSSACPVAAGVAGLLVSAAPDKTAAELYEVLIKTAKPAPFAVPDMNGHDPVFGYGIINPVAALKDVLGIQDVPDAGPEMDAGEQDPPDPPDVEDESGCGCSLPGAPLSAASGSLAAGAALFLGYAVRRRRRR